MGKSDWIGWLVGGGIALAAYWWASNCLEGDNIPGGLNDYLKFPKLPFLPEMNPDDKCRLCGITCD